MFIIGGAPPLGEEEPYEITFVGRSVTRSVMPFSSIAVHGIFSETSH